MERRPDEISVITDDLSQDQLESILNSWVDSLSVTPEKVLLLPPDFTRGHSQAGPITAALYRLFKPTTEVDIMPALGTHMPMTCEERSMMYGGAIPSDRFLVHNWRSDIVKIGEVPSDYVREVSEGLLDFAIDVELNKALLDESYDLIISIGQVVPHEVVGMANYTKNVLVGCGGKSMIDRTHFLSAIYGIERIMGRDHSPVRKVFDYAEDHFLRDLPLQYLLTVTTVQDHHTSIRGLFVGRDRSLFEQAVRLSQEHNVTWLDRPLGKAIVYLDPAHFKSTWLGNKAIYRTRPAIADGGELLIIAPGVRQFGEDQEADTLIRKYGYFGAVRVMELVRENEDLGSNLSTAAHLIHGSSEGRFRISYAAGGLTRQEVEAAGYDYAPLSDALARYDPGALQEGYNTVAGEEVYFVGNPALGLWLVKESGHAG